MKVTGQIPAGQNQLRWVVLLLAIAVILPTVCLLWFMSQAVRNERLAVRQKLTDVYQRRLDTLSRRADALWSDRINSLGAKAVGRQAVELFGLFAGRDDGTGDSPPCDAVIVYDSNDKLVYPIVASAPSEPSGEFNEAWRAEFIEENFARAAALYERMAGAAADDYVRYSAMMGKVRCLRKSADMDEAIAQCSELAYGQTPPEISPSSASLVARARVLLAELKAQTERGLDRSDVQTLIDSAVNYTAGSDSDFLAIPSETRIFLLRRAIEIVEKSEWADQLQSQVVRAKQLLSSEELVAAFLDKYGSTETPEPWSQDTSLKLVSSLRLLLNTFEEVQWNYTDYAERLKQQISTVLDSYESQQGRARPGVSQKSALSALLASWSPDSFRRLELPQAVYGVHHTIGRIRDMRFRF
ncbi:MAG: hypothetical protein P8Z79_05295 [Sedimentisphaerales bacterium]